MGALVVVSAACTGQTPARTASPGRTTTATPTALAACAASQRQPDAPDGVSSSQPLWVIATGLSQPDDLYFDRDGSLLVGEYNAGRVTRLGSQGGSIQVATGLGEPEGIARIGETLYVADQSRDRVLAVDGSGHVSTFFQLSPVSGVLGLDQIAAEGDTLIVPDSPRGTVLFVNQQGQVTRRAAGFVRPTGAWPLADGSVLISDENANAVFKLLADGSRTRLATLSVADDAVQTPDGRVFAISEENGQLVQVGGGMVAGGLKTAQGLTEDGAGNLYVTENAAGRVDLVLLTFKIVPQSSGSPAVLARNQPLCVQVARSSGFSRPVVLQGGQGYRVISQPNGDQPGEVLPEACTSEKCSIRITAQNGQLTDGAWFEYRSS